MIQTCHKCGKEYEPKRRGGKFCSTSCRVTRHQLLRRGRIVPLPIRGDEEYLANKLVAIGRSAQEALRQVQDLPTEEALAELKQLVREWSGVAYNSVIERILQR